MPLDDDDGSWQWAMRNAGVAIHLAIIRAKAVSPEAVEKIRALLIEQCQFPNTDAMKREK